MDFKITVPITAASDALFDSEVKRTPSEPGEPGMAQEEVDKINAAAKAEYEEEHPSLSEFVDGIRGKD